MFQDLALCENLDVTANLFLGHEWRGHLRRDDAGMEQVARDVLGRLASRIPSVRTPLSQLSAGQRQTVAIAIRVRPGASRTRVGGRHGDRLVVAVGARAVDGAATEAALDALARALGLRRRQLTLMSGATSRDKVVEVDAPDDAELAVRLAALTDRPL